MDPETGETLCMTDEAKGLREVAGHVMPYTDICFFAEPPEYIQFDSVGRLHGETGPAACYPDLLHVIKAVSIFMRGTALFFRKRGRGD